MNPDFQFLNPQQANGMAGSTQQDQMLQQLMQAQALRNGGSSNAQAAGKGFGQLLGGLMGHGGSSSGEIAI